MGTTKKELLEDLFKKPWSLERQKLVRAAQRGDYHDFDSELATPKLVLNRDLVRAGYLDLALKVRSGAYDEQPTDAQVAQMRQELGPELFDALMGERNKA